MIADFKSRTGRIGVAGTQLIFGELGWIFREQPIEDYGIDAQIEIVDKDKPTGKLIALQIKSGKSWFSEKNKSGFIFRGEEKHLKYWQEHSLPVLIILYCQESGSAYWQIVNKSNVQKTKKGWKLTVPFDNTLNESSLDRIRDFSTRMTSTKDYTILELKDGSTGTAKRYSANILLSKEFSKSEVVETVDHIIEDLKTREYYRSDLTKNRWQGKSAQVIWLFLYVSLDDVGFSNWICHAQYIDANLPKQFSPSKISGDVVGKETVLIWNKSYEEKAKFLASSELSKEVYIDEMLGILNFVKPLMESAVRLTENLELNLIEDNEYIRYMSQLEAKIADLYFKGGDLGLAPSECRDLSQTFQCIIADAQNIVLPFSEKGLKTWIKKNRDSLVKKAIRAYEEDFLKLEFELSKVR